MKKLVISLGIFWGLFFSPAYASDAEIAAALDKLGYTKESFQINNTPMQNMKNVTTPDGVFYITDDGKYLIQGSIYNLEGNQPENIANANNIKLISTIAKEAIVYKAPNEKHIVYVFTDYTCHYCKLLHENIDSYLDAGISVHYFAFPRQGLNSPVAKDMQSIWSTANRKKAFDDAYKGAPVKPASSMVPYVKMQFDVGRKIGISGTPAIVLPSGQLLAGYVPADELVKLLNKDTK